MSHLHSVYDNDKHFSIDPATREIKNESGKVVLINHDHNSERFTFEIPKTVDGHDMSLCNVVQIHYLNIEKETKIEYEGIYEVDDLRIRRVGEETVTCSWLISRNATQYIGSLNFAVRFACVADNGEVEYDWSTAIHKGIAISDGIRNTEVVAEEYSDILEQWRKKLFITDMVEQYAPEEGRAYLGAAARISTTASIGTAWSGSAPYTQTVTVSGIMATDTPHIAPVYSSTLDTAIAQKNAWSMISEAEAANNAIIFTCFEEKPTINIPIQIEVIR